MVLSDKIGLILINFVWQATVISVITALLLFLFKKADSRLKYIICFFSLLVMFTTPFFFTFSNFINSPDSSEKGPLGQINQTNGEEVFYNGNLLGITYRTDEISISPYEEFVQYVNRYSPFFTLIWMFGVVVITSYRIYGFSKLKHIVRQTSPIEKLPWLIKIKELLHKTGINRTITILQSASVDTPSVIGFLKPVMLIPVTFFSGVESKYVEAIILHELAHIKRYDYAANIIQMIIETLGFFHPAVWWISKRIRIERENCCDDFAVEIFGDKLIYAKSLIQLEEWRHTTSFVTAANGANLSLRILRLLGKDTKRVYFSFYNFTALSVAVVFIMSTISFAMIKPDDADWLNSLFKTTSNKTLDDYLIAFFPFNGNANDESVFRQNTTLQNAVLCEDRFGNKNRAYDFNGKNSSITMDKKNKVNQAESITVSSWIFPRRAENWESWICKDGIKWASEWRVGFGENNNTEWGLTTCKLLSKRNYWANYWITDSEIKFNTWTHVAVTADRDNNIVTVYMNGEKVGIISDLSHYEKVEGCVRIGYQTDDRAYFDGKIDDIRIYNRVLSASEVREVYEME